MKNNELMEFLTKTLEAKYQKISTTKIDGNFFCAIDVVVDEEKNEAFRITVSKFETKQHKLVSCNS